MQSGETFGEISLGLVTKTAGRTQALSMSGNEMRGNKASHCRISYRGGLGMSPSIIGLTTQDPYIQKEHTELYKILKFRVNWANIEQDAAIQKLQNLKEMYGFPDNCPAIHTFVSKF